MWQIQQPDCEYGLSRYDGVPYPGEPQRRSTRSPLAPPSPHCHPITAIPSLPSHHCHPITAIPSLPSHHCHPITAIPSLPSLASLPDKGLSRRNFLQAAVAAAGTAGASALSHEGQPSCTCRCEGRAQAVDVTRGLNNTNYMLEIDPGDLAKFPDGTCIVLTASAGDAPPSSATITRHHQRQNSTHIQHCSCPLIPNDPGRDEYPSHSTICGLHQLPSRH